MNCKVDDCQRPVKYGGKQLCQTHYHRLYRGGDLGGAESKINRYDTTVCEVEGCDTRRQKGSPRCSKHEGRFRRHGSTDVVLTPRVRTGPENNRWTGDDATYAAVHLRLRKNKGPASGYTCPCGKDAAQWAYTHEDPNGKNSEFGPYSTNPEFYTAMCVPCHKKFDLGREGS